MLKCILAAVLCAAILPLAAQHRKDLPPPKKETPAAKKEQQKKTPYTFVKLFRSNADPEKYDDPAKAAELFKQRETLVKKLHDTQRQIVRNDNRARKIHQEMKKLMDELTIIIESREEVKKINSDLKKLDGELDQLPLKGAKKPEPEKKNKPQK